MGKDKNLNVGLTLLVENPGSAEPVLPIGWCVEPKTLDTIQRHQIRNPHLFLLVVEKTLDWRYGDEPEPIYNYKVINRMLLPLKQGLEYVQIKNPGKYRILATIVGDDRTVDALRRYYIDHCRRDDLITIDGKFRPRGYHSLRQASLDIEVGKEFFAHEPAEWEKNWVNLWFKEHAKDQCEFRRRRLIAYSIQLIVMSIMWLTWSLLSLIGAITLFVGGFRHITWSAICKPWKSLTNNSWGVSSKVVPTDSVFFQSPDGKVRWFLIPAFPYFSLIVVFLGAILTRHHDWLWLLKFFARVFPAAYVICSLILFGLRKIEERLASVSEEEQQARQEAADRTAREVFLAKQREDLLFLQCSRRASAPSLKSLPHPTIRLRFLALKSKVCRPFSYS